MFHFLLIEFLDELIFGLREAAWPQIRNELHLSYTQIGLLLGLPGVVSSLIEPILGILSDRGKRIYLIWGGGVFYAVSLFMTGISQTFLLILVSFMIFYPSSGAFVSLSQTAVMDSQPHRREKNMAKWSFAGSLGVVIGPLLLSGIIHLGGNWRNAFLAFCGMTFLLLFTQRKMPVPQLQIARVPWVESIKNVFTSFLKPAVLRWLILLTLSDLMLDVLLGYLSLYFVDVVSVSQDQAGLAVGVWAIVGLIGGFLLIPLLGKISGILYLKRSAVIVSVLFPTFLLVRGYGIKLLLVGSLGLLNAGWYSILKARLYDALPNSSGLVVALSNIFGIFSVFIPWILGLIADYYGLPTAMWLLLLSPVGLLLGLPKDNTPTGLQTKMT